MKKSLVFTFVMTLLLGLSVQGQEPVFEVVKRLEVSSVEDQYKTSICWAYAGLAFLETEARRLGVDSDVRFSENFVVYCNYLDKATRYVRLGGKLHFAPGGTFTDVMAVVEKYGLMPCDRTDQLDEQEFNELHLSLDKRAKAYVSDIVATKDLDMEWMQGYKTLIDSLMQVGISRDDVSPLEYASRFKLDDYISLTSFTHHPFYSQFAVEVPDNWRWSLSWNLPINELTDIVDQSINQGYTVCWSTDVSNDGFSRDGLAVVPNGEDMDDAQIQQLRQEAFDRRTMTDDHGMLICGLVKDQEGKEYYLVQNSWGVDSGRDGFWYVSKNYFKLNTINITVNKNSLPRSIWQKLFK